MLLWELMLTQSIYLVSSNYVIMVTMFFTVSVINNYALNFNIAMPLHMIFRAVGVSVMFLLFSSSSACLLLKLLPQIVTGIADCQHGPRNNHPEKEVCVSSQLTAALNCFTERLHARGL